MRVTDKGQVMIAKHIRTAAGVASGSEVSFSLDAGKIVITPVASHVRNDRRAKLRAVAAKLRSSFSPEFAQLGAREITKLPPARAAAAAVANLASYDGSAGVLVDTHVWVDCTDAASPWHDWAVDQLQLRSERAPLHVNLIIYTELLAPGQDVRALDELLDV